MNKNIYLLIIGLILTSSIFILSPRSEATAPENNGIFENYYVAGTLSIKEIKGDMDYKIKADVLLIFNLDGKCEVFMNEEILYIENFKIYYEHSIFNYQNEDVFFALGTCEKFFN